MKLGVTGAHGFIGWHLSLKGRLHAAFDEILPATRRSFADPEQLERFVSRCDCIIHLAGVNRASDEEIRRGNVELAEDLVGACERSGATPAIVYASTTQVEAGTVYGDAKQEASEALQRWCSSAGAAFTGVVIPNVFGEFGRPFYNSFVATFCHQLVAGDQPRVIEDRLVELVHVQEVCDQLLRVAAESTSGPFRIRGQEAPVSEILSTLRGLHREYEGLGQVPDLSEPLSRSLFNTYRSFYRPSLRCRDLQPHNDSRGTLFELLRAGSGGQCFASMTRPGVLRGEHFHLHKFESFFVIRGDAEIRVRKVTTNQVETLRVSGEEPSRVDIPTFHTHDLQNVGTSELTTLFWADEFFDPERPDTYGEKVEVSLQ